MGGAMNTQSRALELADQLKERHGCNVLTSQAAAELRRLAAVEAELERIRALPPVAWKCATYEGETLKNSCIAMNYQPPENVPLKFVTPLFDITPKDPT